VTNAETGGCNQQPLLKQKNDLDGSRIRSKKGCGNQIRNAPVDSER
jgi:hypothetical protein